MELKASVRSALTLVEQLRMMDVYKFPIYTLQSGEYGEGKLSDSLRLFMLNSCKGEGTFCVNYLYEGGISNVKLFRKNETDEKPWELVANNIYQVPNQATGFLIRFIPKGRASTEVFSIFVV